MYNYLVLPTYGSDQGVNWDHQHHERKPSEDRVAQCEVEEDERENNLQWGRPDHVEVTHEVHEALGVHRHQVDDLSDGFVTARSVVEVECLQCREGEMHHDT